jgi:hypothetical protein
MTNGRNSTVSIATAAARRPVGLHILFIYVLLSTIFVANHEILHNFAVHHINLLGKKSNPANFTYVDGEQQNLMVKSTLLICQPFTTTLGKSKILTQPYAQQMTSGLLHP